MSNEIRYRALPMQAAGTCDVNDAIFGRPVQQGVVRLGGTYGDWTLYVVRDVNAAPGTLMNRVNLELTIGHDRAAADTVVLPELFITLQSMQSWLVYHAVCSELSCNLNALFLGGVKPARDRVNAWIAPGRPTMTPVQHTLLGGVICQIPTFATSIQIHKDLLSPSVLRWYDATGNLIDSSILTLSVAGEIVNVRIPIPNGARAVEPLITVPLSSPNLDVTWWVYA